MFYNVIYLATLQYYNTIQVKDDYKLILLVIIDLYLVTNTDIWTFSELTDHFSATIYYYNHQLYSNFKKAAVFSYSTSIIL